MDRLDELENRSIFLIREAFALFKRIGLLWSMGKDSTALLVLCRKAFLGTVPFPVIHIDTGRKFDCMYIFRDHWAKIWQLNLLVAKHDNLTTVNCDPGDKLACCTRLKTEVLRHTVAAHSFDAIMLAIRRDEHGIRGKERHFSPRDDNFRWDYANQPAQLWDLFESKVTSDAHIRVHPLLDWTEIDIWQYIRRENIPTVELYFARNGKRYRSIGCVPCCQPVESSASTINQVIAELRTTTVSERRGRAQDKEAAYAMQQLRALGYM